MDNVPIKILIVDDHTLVREGFAKMLELVPEFEIIGQAKDAGEALKLSEKLSPEVILMDVRLPDTSGIEATKIIKKVNPETEVIILSMYDDEEYLLEAVKAGATGYLLKDVALNDLIKAIKIVHQGGSLIQPEIARRILKEVAAKRSSHSALEKVLTDREIEILREVADGNSNKEIGKNLNISDKTVKTHLRTVFRKLKVADRAQAVALAMRKGLVD